MTDKTPNVTENGAQSPDKWDGSGPTPQQLADLKARLEGEDAEEAGTTEGGKRALAPDEPIAETPAFIDGEGKAVSFMDLLNQNREMTNKADAGELAHVDAETGERLPAVALNVPHGFTAERDLLTGTELENRAAPGEKPVQPVGSQTDVSGKNLHEVTLTPGVAAWTPNPAPASQEGAEGDPKAPAKNW